jgi:hypothetical protein
MSESRAALVALRSLESVFLPVPRSLASSLARISKASHNSPWRPKRRQAHAAGPCAGRHFLNLHVR